MFLKYLVMSILMLCSLVKANPLSDYVDAMSEQEQVSAWVRQSTKNTITVAVAEKIVKEAYANGYEKDVDPWLVLSVMRNESNFKENASSRDGSRGLMQIIPKWHKAKLAGRNPLGLTTSVEVGTWILRDCLVKHKQIVSKALSCYSGGGGNAYYNKVMKHQNSLIQSVKQDKILIASW